MDKHIRALGIVVVITVCAIAVWIAVSLRPSSSGVDDGAASDSAPFVVAAGIPTPDLPACPDVDLGVDLQCLGSGPRTPGNAQPASGTAVVNIWAWWCEPCRAELPVIARFASEHPDIAVVGVHADQDSARGAAWLIDQHMSLPTFGDPANAFAPKYNLPNVVPTTVVLRDGHVAAVHPGVITSADELEDLLARS